MPFSLDTVLSAAGGGTVGVLGLWVWLTVTNRMVNPKFYIAEIDKRDATLKEERAYSRAVAADLADVLKSVNADITPVMTSVTNQLTTLGAWVQQDIFTRGAQQN